MEMAMEIENQDRKSKNEEQEEKECIKGKPLSINYFHGLRMRELCNKRKDTQPNIFRDHHLQVFKFPTARVISEVVIAGDIICVQYDGSYIIPFKRDPAGEISPFKSENGEAMKAYYYKNMIDFVCYNRNNESLIVVEGGCNKRIYSLKIKSKKGGIFEKRIQVLPGESNIDCWGFDIENCRGMIYNSRDRIHKVFELKKYNLLFTIADNGYTDFGSDIDFRIRPLENMEMLMTIDEKFSLKQMSEVFLRKEILLKLYSKSDGELRKQVFVPVHPGHHIMFVDLCGSDTILLQQHGLKLEIVKIGSQTCQTKTTEIQATCRPYYLKKRRQFLCYNGETISLYVCNLEGEIIVTIEDHRLRLIRFSDGCYVTAAEDILISLCYTEEPRHLFYINVSSIITGQSLARIPARTVSRRSSNYREGALDCSADVFAYDERSHEIFTGNCMGICSVWSSKLFKDVVVDGIRDYYIVSSSRDDWTEDEDSDDRYSREEDESHNSGEG